MLLQLSQLIGRGVVALSSRQVIGRIKEPLFDPTNGRLLALAVHPRGWFAKQQLLAASDILGVEPGFIVIGKTDDLVDPKDLLRAHEVMIGKIRVLGATARTESGARLGDIFDLLVETEAWQITKYYVRHLLSERIFLAEDVQSITKQGVIFFDRVISGGTVSEAETAVV